jgi:protein phosphatase 1L
MDDKSNILIDQANEAYERQDYQQAMNFYTQAAFSLIFGSESETSPKSSMEKAIACYQKINPHFFLDESLDYIQQYFSVVRHWFDHQEHTGLAQIHAEISREIPLDYCDSSREELPENETSEQLLMIGNYAVSIASGQGIRESMEDAHCAKEFELRLEGSHILDLFCVFDGHGGKTCAHFAARELPIILKKELQNMESLSDQSIYNALIKTAIQTDETWKELPFQKTDLKDTSGTTATIALIIDKKTLWVANIGDSGAIIDREGKAVQLTEKAKPTIPKYHKEIFLRGGIVGYGRVDATLDMARSIGDLNHPSVSAKPTIKKFELSSQNHTLILACDGLWDVIDPETAFDSIAEIMPDLAAVHLRKLAYQRGSTDNVTILVVSLH